ncbi:hypothetical protein [Sutcliffiella horikoshii]|uniref:Uncharacterized protein n=1 Tax=Sutcliffiella horikoshii TaxID=79883 RepID=A0A5D4TAH9_9BACI|nr:hypothetical protein [Sutcliffiella horikoshii]TYS71718.1 hypothetical protein FZC75_11170 [Sutcliffiella horikoshii]
MKKANTRIPKLEKGPSTCLTLNILKKTNVAIDKRSVLIKSAANTPNRLLAFCEDVQMENEVDMINENIKVRYTAISTKIPLIYSLFH